MQNINPWEKIRFLIFICVVGNFAQETTMTNCEPKAMVIELTVSQICPGSSFFNMAAFLLWNKWSKEHVINAAKT